MTFNEECSHLYNSHWEVRGIFLAFAGLFAYCTACSRSLGKWKQDNYKLNRIIELLEALDSRIKEEGDGV